MRVRNVGDAAAPVGVGMHPYLHVGAHEDGGIGGAELTVPARTALETEGGAAHRRRSTGSTATSAGSVTGPSTPRSPTWSATTTAGPGCGCAGRSGELELAVDESWPWLQIYSGDTLPDGQRRRSLAVEPMTCPPNALADGVDLVVLEPGGDWSGTWTLGWTAA